MMQVDVYVQIHHGPMTHHHLLAMIIFVKLECYQVKAYQPYLPC